MFKFADITPDLARLSGFNGVIDLLKIAKHGRGENVYLIRFHYVPLGTSLASRKRRRVRRTALRRPASRSL